MLNNQVVTGYLYDNDQPEATKRFYILIYPPTNKIIHGWFHVPSVEEREERYGIAYKLDEITWDGDLIRYSDENCYVMAFYEWEKENK